MVEIGFELVVPVDWERIFCKLWSCRDDLSGDIDGVQVDKEDDLDDDEYDKEDRDDDRELSGTLDVMVVPAVIVAVPGSIVSRPLVVVTGLTIVAGVI